MFYINLVFIRDRTPEITPPTPKPRKDEIYCTFLVKIIMSSKFLDPNIKIKNQFSEVSDA